jgi:hypothetical protein
MAHLCPQRSTEFHAFGAASNPSSVQQHVECPESDESNPNQKKTRRLFRGSNPNKLAKSDKSDRSDTKNELSDCSTVGLPLARGHAADRGLPEALVVPRWAR